MTGSGNSTSSVAPGCHGAPLMLCSISRSQRILSSVRRRLWTTYVPDASPTIFSVVVRFTPRNIPGFQRLSALWRVLCRNSTRSPNGGRAILHGLPFNRLNAVMPSEPTEYKLTNVPACSINHARSGCFAGMSHLAWHATDSLNVRIMPWTSFTLASASPLDFSWPSLGEASGIISPTKAILDFVAQGPYRGLPVRREH